MPRLSILGTRGIPGAHGGFETFAEQLALYLSQQGWQVTVYCQAEGDDPIHEDYWQGIRRLIVPVRQGGPLGTILYDWHCVKHARKDAGLVLTLGYNTAVFSALYAGTPVRHLMNMDGFEWKRAKWSLPVRAWFYLNEHVGARISHHLIADNPHIAAHLQRRTPARRITMIPYASEPISTPDDSLLAEFGLQANGYLLLIARPEPENSILELVQAFCARPRRHKLLVLGNYTEAPYPRAVKAAANDHVVFAGAIYSAPHLHTLRTFATLYLHGHQVGGTNPSLVEALAAGNAVLAHDNPFNRWVAGDAARYFNDVASADDWLSTLLNDERLLGTLQAEARQRHRSTFMPAQVLGAYEKLLAQFANAGPLPALQTEP